MADHIFLDDRDLLRRHLDAEVATRDHHAVRGFENVFQLIECLRLLQFRDHGNGLVVLGNNLLHFEHVSGGPHK